MASQETPVTGVASAVASLILFDVFLVGCQFATMLVLVRWLQPRDYGVWAFANGIVGTVAVFGARTFLEAAFQIKDNEVLDVRSFFVAGGLLQSALFGLSLLAATALGFTDAWRPAAPILAVMAIGLLVDLPAQLSSIILQRDMAFGTIARMNALGFLIGSGVAIGMAYQGAGAYALVAQTLLPPVPLAILLFFGGFRPSFQFDYATVKRSVAFGVRRVQSGVFIMTRTAAERFFMTARYGFGALGVFERAQALSALTVQKGAITVSAAVYPLLAKTSDVAQRRRLVRLLLVSGTWMAAFAASLMVVIGDELVRWVYGNKWLDVLPLIIPSMICGVALATFHMNYRVVLSSGAAKTCVYLDALVLSLTAISLPLLLIDGNLRAYLFALGAAYTLAAAVAAGSLVRQRLVSGVAYLRAVLVPVFTILFAVGVGEVLSRNFRQPIWCVTVGAASVASMFLIAARALATEDLRSFLLLLPRAEVIVSIMRLGRRTVGEEQER
jgi:O-antigen/teichoic acid export membrane protein